MNETNERTNSSNALERAPSALSTDCPIETCLEFSVVDYWGNPVTSPSKFELDGKPVQPDTPIFNLASRAHILKAVDGEELRKQILNFPYQPIKTNPFPAKLLADKKEYKFIPADKDNIWRGIPLTTSPNEKCCKYVIEVDQGIDYYILMVFLDNHSGGFHGTGHAGVLIINGKNRDGLYTDFGEDYVNIYTNEGRQMKLGDIKIFYINDELIDDKNYKIYENILGKYFHNINMEYGSNIFSKNCCIRTRFLPCGPFHEGMNILNYSTGYVPAGFAISGLIAWALYALPGGAFDRMNNYIQFKEDAITKLQEKKINCYSLFSFNCMTYSLSVLDKGLGLERKPGKSNMVDWPNLYISEHMKSASDKGIFNNRFYLSEPDIITYNTNTTNIEGIRHQNYW